MEENELFDSLYSRIEDIPVEMRGVTVNDKESRKDIISISENEFVNCCEKLASGALIFSTIPKNIPWEYYSIDSDESRSKTGIFQLLSRVMDMEVKLVSRREYTPKLETIRCRLFIDWYYKKSNLKLSYPQMQINRDEYDNFDEWEEIQKPGLLTKAAK